MTDMQTKAVENAVWNPENAHGALHLGIDVGSTTVKLAVLTTRTKSSTPSTSATTPMSAHVRATCSRVRRRCCPRRR